MNNPNVLRHETLALSSMRTQRPGRILHMLAFGLALGYALLLPLQAVAKQGTGHLNVGVAVQAYAHSTSIQPSQLVIGNDDLSSGHGYVDVPSKNNPNGVSLTVRTNDRAGYTLVFAVTPEVQALISGIQISGLSVPVALPASGGEVFVPFAGTNVNASLSVRFLLQPKNASNTKKNMPAGTYAWPLLISARPN